MTGLPDAIYLSAHLDDAALSCGGQIAAQVMDGRRIQVVTVFAGDEPAEAPSGLVRDLHAAFGLPAGGVVAARRAEDADAMRCLGCEHDRWDLIEGIYRVDTGTGTPLYPCLNALFGNVPPAETPLLETLCRRLESLPTAQRVVVPLGIGGQVDHILLRQAAEACFDFTTLVYYEDYPYVEKPMALWRVLGWRRHWRPRTTALKAAALEAKLAAIGCYRSQIRPLFGDGLRLQRRIRRHNRRRGGERVWIRTAAERER